MSAEPARRHLALVDAATGEVVESRELQALQAENEKLHGDLKAAERDLRAKRRRIGELERDRARERLEHPQRDLILRVLRYWHRKCKAGDRRIHAYSPDRFDAVAALVEMERIVRDEGVRGKRRREWVYEFEHFKAAVDGAAFDAYEMQRKNGSVVRYDDATLVFRSAAKMDEFIARCPYEVRPILPARPSPDEVASGAAKCENPAGFQPPSAVQPGEGKQEGSTHGTNALGEGAGRVPLRVEGFGAQLRGRLGDRGPRLPPAI